ncbi:MAG: zinc ribbon domain-containing protein [Candidatus Kapabacteria bacterium]|nr:zinc ribbon domain-containing protein [Candidatus Kapabacteria bacterium]
MDFKKYFSLTSKLNRIEYIVSLVVSIIISTIFFSKIDYDSFLRVIGWIVCLLFVSIQANSRINDIEANKSILKFILFLFILGLIDEFGNFNYLDLKYSVYGQFAEFLLIIFIVILAILPIKNENLENTKKEEIQDNNIQQNEPIEPNIPIEPKVSIPFPEVCPHCKSPNTAKSAICEWCGYKFV